MNVSFASFFLLPFLMSANPLFELKYHCCAAMTLLHHKACKNTSNFIYLQYTELYSHCATCFAIVGGYCFFRFDMPSTYAFLRKNVKNSTYSMEKYDDTTKTYTFNLKFYVKMMNG